MCRPSVNLARRRASHPQPPKAPCGPGVSPAPGGVSYCRRLNVSLRLSLNFQLRSKEITKGVSCGEEKRRQKMRTMLMSAAALGLVATLLTGPAQADRMCRKVCHDGFCKSECVSSGPRLYMHGGDRYNHHRRDMHGPGVDVEINRR
jgi:hypothetical protein